ncbi:hypothetical protein [Ralstonia solanacearum]|uniref:Uncharacterized protein n=1 Tax=Ralstonia solanacearum TaxID=305 RepID=A0AAD0WIH0_RALSL|nr:hypothetical protein [Ralstonia solanacearum]AXV84034.1 hypothetical protein CJO77_21075 [Ralstonia solanacearum]AXW55164.1 hypothetical protein CJO92_21085 [Ralstonia solanacearum]CBJ35320.1 hypothethical protein [Ralstonia solanacearum PSI07]
MEPSELFFLVGRLELSEEQSAQIESELGKRIDSIPIYRVVAVSSTDQYLPVVGVPGIAGMIVHYGAQPEEAQRGGLLIASVLEEMANEVTEGRVFAAHSKLMAPRPDVGHAKLGKGN